MTGSHLDEQERSAIVADLRVGYSVRGTAKKHHRAASTVSAIAAAAGIDTERSRTKKAAAARRDYARDARLDLLNRVFDRVEQMLPDCRKPQELAQLTTALAIAIDKRRLEDGEATSRSEVSSSGVRDRIASRLDELSARRAAKGVA